MSQRIFHTISYRAQALLALIVLSLSSPFASAQEGASSPEYETISAHGQAGQGWLPEVTLTAEDLTLEGEELLHALKPQLMSQLRYLIGNLHGIESGAALHKATLSDVRKLEVLGEGLARYRYTAELELVISRAELYRFEGGAPLKVTLPARVDPEGLSRFFERAGQDCTPNPHRSYEAQDFWYYVRPLAYYCELSKEQRGEVSVNAELLFSAQAQGAPRGAPLAPHYKELWEDGRLTVTAVYALVGGLLGEQGQEGYQALFEELIRTYGPPLEINDEALVGAELIDVDRPVIHAVFATPRGPLEVHLFLINSLDEPSHQPGDALETFFEDYGRLTARADLVIYNGHARYGSNNAKLDALGEVGPDRHQLFFVNTCSSYTYGLPRFTSASRAANAERPLPEGYLDLILNAMPAMGHEIAYMNAHWIHGLVSAEDSYEELLAPLYAKQQMLVFAAPRLSEEMQSSKGDLAPMADHSAEPALVGSTEPTHSASQSGCEQGLTDHKSAPPAALLLLTLVALICSRERATHVA